MVSQKRAGRGIDFLRGAIPEVARSWQGEPLRHARRAVQRDLAHRRRIGEGPPARADVPDAVVRLPPFASRSLREFLKALPEPVRNGSVMRGPLIGAIPDFLIDIVLPLPRSGVPPTNRHGTPVAFQFGILPLERRPAAVEVVHEVRPAVSLYGIQNPEDKSCGFARKSDSAACQSSS